jgi:hypothetical protein
MPTSSEPNSLNGGQFRTQYLHGKYKHGIDVQLHDSFQRWLQYIARASMQQAKESQGEAQVSNSPLCCLAEPDFNSSLLGSLEAPGSHGTMIVDRQHYQTSTTITTG